MSPDVQIAALERRLADVEARLACLRPGHRPITPEPPLAAIIADAAFLTRFSVADIVSELRYTELVRARQAIIWAAHKATANGWSRIGRAIRRDATSVRAGFRRALALRQSSYDFRILTDRLLRQALERLHPRPIEPADVNRLREALAFANPTITVRE